MLGHAESGETDSLPSYHSTADIVSCSEGQSLRSGKATLVSMRLDQYPRRTPRETQASASASESGNVERLCEHWKGYTKRDRIL